MSQCSCKKIKDFLIDEFNLVDVGDKFVRKTSGNCINNFKNNCPPGWYPISTFCDDCPTWKYEGGKK
ncbi:MAG: hypothetical protein QME51_08735 [Planctomycetota bacterium]|nr:hypothetical protein [Planctomycetota bacterium]